MYQEITEDIEIGVDVFYLPNQSDPEDNMFVWAYHITIRNRSNSTIQLLSRHWEITDGIGQVEEVKGPGVVGEQPVINSGESYEYTSGVHLTTSSGIMKGSYNMTSDDKGKIKVSIPAFSLDAMEEQERVLN